MVVMLVLVGSSIGAFFLRRKIKRLFTYIKEQDAEKDDVKPSAKESQSEASVQSEDKKSEKVPQDNASPPSLEANVVTMQDRLRGCRCKGPRHENDCKTACEKTKSNPTSVEPASIPRGGFKD